MNDSKKKQRETIIVIVLLLAFAGIAIYSKNRNAAKSASLPAPGVSDFNVAKANERLNISLTKNASPAAEKTVVRDPFKIPDPVIAEIGGVQKRDLEGAGVIEAEKTEELVLEGVIWGGRENLAIISGEVVSEGETIKGAKVLTIGENGVVLSKDGREIKLTR